VVGSLMVEAGQAVVTAVKLGGDDHNKRSRGGEG
jgi:hypothetical protein